MTLRLTLCSDHEPTSAPQAAHEARVLEVMGERGTLLSSVAAPPGAPLTVVTSTREYEARVRGCRRGPQGGFLLQVRWVNLSKQARLDLAELMDRAPLPHSDRAKDH